MSPISLPSAQPTPVGCRLLQDFLISYREPLLKSDLHTVDQDGLLNARTWFLPFTSIHSLLVALIACCAWRLGVCEMCELSRQLPPI